MKRVVLESPYAAPEPVLVAENEAYAALATLALKGLGLDAYASHLHLTGVLDDTAPFQRAVGISIGLGIAEALDGAVFALDRGWSAGMDAAFRKHQADGRPCFALILAPVIVGSARDALASWCAAFDKAPQPEHLLYQLGQAVTLGPLHDPPRVH